MKRRSLIVVLYLRRSDPKQDESIETQERLLRQWAQQLGYTILRVYIDDGIEGWKAEERLGFQKMIEDAQNLGDFDAVLVRDQERFSRFDHHEFSYYTFILKRAGVEIHSMMDGGKLPMETISEWIMTGVNQHAKLEYVRSLSRNVAGSAVRRALEGKPASATAAYGYRIQYPRDERGKVLRHHPDYGQITVDPDEAETVRWLFAEYTSTSTSVRELARELNRRGVPSPRGKKWPGTTVHNLLQNRWYIGERPLLQSGGNGKFSMATLAGVRSPGTDGEAEGAGKTLPCPAIVDRRTWDEAQRLLAQRRRGSSSNRNKSRVGVFSDLLYCGHCGARMWGEMGYVDFARTKKAYYYQCSTWHRYGRKECNRNRILETALQEALIPEILRELASHLDRLQAACRRRPRKASRPPQAVTQAAKEVERLEREVQDKIAVLHRVPDDLYEDYIDSIRRLREDLHAAKESLSAMHQAAGGPEKETDLAQIERRIQQADALLHSTDPKKLRHALAQTLDRITLFYKHKPGKRIQSTPESATVHLKLQTPAQTSKVLPIAAREDGRDLGWVFRVSLRPAG